MSPKQELKTYKGKHGYRPKHPATASRSYQMRRGMQKSDVPKADFETWTWDIARDLNLRLEWVELSRPWVGTTCSCCLSDSLPLTGCPWLGRTLCAVRSPHNELLKCGHSGSKNVVVCRRYKGKGMMLLASRIQNARWTEKRAKSSSCLFDPAHS